MNAATGIPQSPAVMPMPDRDQMLALGKTPEGQQKMAEEFEAMMMSMLIQQMRQTAGEGLFPGDRSDTFGGMFDMYMGQHLASAQSLGLGELFRKHTPVTRPGTAGPAAGHQPPATDVDPVAARKAYQNVHDTTL